MLTDRTDHLQAQEQSSQSEETTINIGNEPVMQSALDVLTTLESKKRVILASKGNSIPNAVAVANIITEKMLNGNSGVDKIILDTESAAGIGKMTSTIRIILKKTQ